TSETVLHKRRQVATVVDVSVREHHRIDRRAGDRQMAVFLFRLLAPPLKEPTIERVSPPVRLHQMHRAGYRPRRAPECDLHRTASRSATDVSKTPDSSAISGDATERRWSRHKNRAAGRSLSGWRSAGVRWWRGNRG